MGFVERNKRGKAMAKETDEKKLEALKMLRKYLKPGQTILRSVSASGMTRTLDVYAIKGNAPVYLTGYVCNLLGYVRTKEGALKTQGCGQDMGYDVAHNLGYAVYPEGYKCCGEGCPYNEHSNSPYPKRDGKTMHPKSGYVFRHSWI
jgi:hypothetical protein